MPGVLANRHANAHAFDCNGAVNIAGRKQAVFVEHAVIGQFVLENLAADRAPLKDQVGIVERLLRAPGQTDPEGGPVGASRGQLCCCAGQIIHEGGPADQILALVAGKKHLGQRHEIGAVPFALLPGGARLVGIAANVAHGWVHLCKRDAKAVHGLFPAVRAGCSALGIGRKVRNGRSCVSLSPIGPTLARKGR